MPVDATIERPLLSLRPLPARVGSAHAPAPVTENAAVDGREDLTPSVARFRIRADVGLPHVEPGQYLSLGLVVNGRLVLRPYSTSTGAGTQEALEFLIRHVPGGTFTPLLWDLAVGDRLFIGRPKGLFTRIPGDGRTHLFIATGTGLAPFVAMIETLLLEPAPPGVVVVHGVAHLAELAYRERFERWASAGLVEYVPSISRPADPSNSGWTGRTGRIDAILDDVWAAHGLTPDATVAYLCGNPEMIAAGTRILAGQRLPQDAIRSEHYWPA